MAPRVARASGSRHRLGGAIAARGARPAPTLAVAWRNGIAAVHVPGTVAEAGALTMADTVLCLFTSERLVLVAVGVLVMYLGTSRMLSPLRSEIDVTSRARLFHRARLGQVLLTHTIVPVAVTTLAVAVAVVGCAIAGALPARGAATALAIVSLPPILTGCAAMSARRGGRMPQSVLVTAMATDPSGGGLAIATWAFFWPATPPCSAPFRS